MLSTEEKRLCCRRDPKCLSKGRVTVNVFSTNVDVRKARNHRRLDSEAFL